MLKRSPISRAPQRLAQAKPPPRRGQQKHDDIIAFDVANQDIRVGPAAAAAARMASHPQRQQQMRTPSNQFLALDGDDGTFQRLGIAGGVTSGRFVPMAEQLENRNLSPVQNTPPENGGDGFNGGIDFMSMPDDTFILSMYVQMIKAAT